MESSEIGDVQETKEARFMKTFAEGDAFGIYRVVRRLGKGGMGEVWLLRSPSGEEVAAKILDDSLSADHEARKRFLREAELAMTVKHPNLVETYDIGEDPDTGLCYILMEYMPGGTLADYIKSNGALEIDDAVAVVSAIAAALELARQNGIVHRDIKPANIMFDIDGTPKLADLGIARSGASDSDTTTLTQTGVMIGTPAYMAPEQMLDAHHVDTRADIYSLGVVFYEMLTGERPNKDDTVVQILAKAVKGEPIPDVRTLRPEVSASLAQLLNMMVVPDKDGRISTPGQITNAIDIIARTGGCEIQVAVPGEASAKRSAKGLAKFSTVVVAAALVVVVSFAVVARLLLARGGRGKPADSVVVTNVVTRMEKTKDGVAISGQEKKSMREAQKTPDVKNADNDAVRLDRVVPYSRIPAEYKKDIDRFYASRKDSWSNGCMFFGKIATQDGSPLDNVLSWTLLDKNTGRFSGGISNFQPWGKGVVFIKPGYRPLTIDVPESSAKWGCSNVVWLGKHFLRKLTPDKEASFSFSVAAPALSDGRDRDISVSVYIDNAVPTCNDHANFHGTRTSSLVQKVTLRGGGTVSVAACSGVPAEYRARISGNGYAPRTAHFKVDEGSIKDFGKVELLPDKDIVFHVRNYDEKGQWKKCAGRLAQWDIDIGEISGSADRCSFFIYPYEFMGKGFGVSFSHSRWETYDDYGEISKDTFDLLAKGGKLPSPRRLERGNTYPMHVCFQPGHVYRLILKEPQRIVSRNGRKPYDIDFLVYVDPLTAGTGRAGAALEDFAPARTSKPVSDKNAVCNAVQKASDAKSTDRSPRHAKIDGTTWTYRIVDGCAFLMCAESRALLSVPCVDPAPKGVLKIPSQLDGCPVTTIGVWAFNKCDAITEVHVPESVTRIDYGAFCNCRNLQSVFLPSNLSGEFAEAFKYCNKLSKISFTKTNPHYKVYNGDVYSGDKKTLIMMARDGRESFGIPKTVQRISSHAFEGTSIKSLEIPRGVRELGSSAFFGCNNLVEVTFNGVVERMGTCVFGYSGLERISFPDGTKSIPPETFRSCSRLKEVSLPDSLERIEGHATFEGCSSLVELHLPKRLQVLGESQLFNHCKSLERLVVPASVNAMSGDSGTFRGCSRFRELVFEGNAPRLTGRGPTLKGRTGAWQMFDGAPGNVQVVVKPDSVGWAGENSRNLPDKWPVNGGEGARRIVYSSSLPTGDIRDIAAPEQANREVPVEKAPAEFQADLKALQRCYKWYSQREGEGRLVFGKLQVEGSTAEDVATWAWMGKDGAFTAAAIMAAKTGITFEKHGYESLTVPVDDAQKPWRDDVAIDLGTIAMRRLPKDELSSFTLTPRMPSGVEEGWLVVSILNNRPVGSDWGTQGRAKTSSEVARIKVKNGRKVVVDGCSPTTYCFTLEANGCATYYSGSDMSSGIGGIKLLPTEKTDIGDITLRRVRTAVFKTRPFSGGKWQRRTVKVDGKTALLLKDEKDECGNSCRLHLSPYGCEIGEVSHRFGWGGTSYEDFGKMSALEFESLEKKGKVPQGKHMEESDPLKKGHIYRIKNDWHWKSDILVAFETY